MILKWHLHTHTGSGEVFVWTAFLATFHRLFIGHSEWKLNINERVWMVTSSRTRLTLTERRSRKEEWKERHTHRMREREWEWKDEMKKNTYFHLSKRQFAIYTWERRRRRKSRERETSDRKKHLESEREESNQHRLHVELKKIVLLLDTDWAERD